MGLSSWMHRISDPTPGVLICNDRTAGYTDFHPHFYLSPLYNMTSLWPLATRRKFRIWTKGRLEKPPQFWHDVGGPTLA